MLHTPELAEVNRSSNERMVQSLFVRFKDNAEDNDTPQFLAVIEILVETFNALEARIFSCTDEDHAQLLINEWRVLAKSYLANYLD